MKGFSYHLLCPLLLVMLAVNVLVGVGKAGETLPWGIERIRADKVWDANGDLMVDGGSINGTEIRTAMIDTGIDNDHPDLLANLKGGKSFIPGENYYPDVLNHGTPVAGIIAAVDNEEGVIGGAPKAYLYMARAILLASTPPQFVADAIMWAVDNWGAQIITMSFAMPYDQQVSDAIDYAYANNVVLIAGSGNTNKNEIEFPARHGKVIAVGAVDQNNQRWVESATVGSNYGPELDLVAPGVNINSTLWNDTWGTNENTGTSFAVPHVTAVAALLLSSKINPKYDSNHDGRWSNREVNQTLISLAKDLGPPGRDDQYGYGLVDAVLRDTAVDFATSYKTRQGKGYPLKIFVTVKNLGITTESLNVEAYVLNSNYQEVFDQWINDVHLNSGESTTLTFIWNVPDNTPKGDYTIHAYTPPPQEDIEVNNNYYEGNTVRATIAGDVNGDYTVNNLDATILIYHYGHSKSFQNPGHVPEDWNADINSDCNVDIYDASILSLNYGITDP